MFFSRRVVRQIVSFVLWNKTIQTDHSSFQLGICNIQLKVTLVNLTGRIAGIEEKLEETETANSGFRTDL